MARKEETEAKKDSVVKVEFPQKLSGREYYFKLKLKIMPESAEKKHSK